SAPQSRDGRMRRLAFALALAVTGGALPARAAGDEARRVAPDHLYGTADEMAGWWAVIEEKWVRAREVGERVVKQRPQSWAGHYVLAMAMHYGEGDLARALFHLEQARKLFEREFGATPMVEGPWRWHEATLRE